MTTELRFCDADHPLDPMLRGGRIPHIFCPGCGIGSAMQAFLEGVAESGVPRERLAVVSGIGCTGRVAGYLEVDSFHTTHGRPIPFATGLKLARPELTVVVFSGDGDLAAIGGNHLIHAARRNIDLHVVCVNNFTYGMTGGQVAPTTPLEARSSTTTRGGVEPPFNLVDLVAACGAVYVARWLSLDVRRIKAGIRAALAKEGFTFTEIVSPCPVGYGRRNDTGDEVAMSEALAARCVVETGGDPRAAAIGLDGPIRCGTFVDTERAGFCRRLEQLRQRFAPESAS